jgi:phosphatidylinositol alpha-1,6-mannosyltransferase
VTTNRFRRRASGVLLGAESLMAGSGGIGRVGRLISRVLAESLAPEQLSAIAFHDCDVAPDVPMRTQVARGSRISFAVQWQWAAARHSHFVYDSEAMARLHALLPWSHAPFLTFIHGIEVWEGADPKRARTASKASMLLANSSYTVERASRTNPDLARAKVCWLATEEDDAPSPTRRAAGPPVVLVLGRLDNSRYKGHEELIDCWPKVVDAMPNARLRIVGRGPALDYFRQKASTKCGGDTIEFWGFVPECRLDSAWDNVVTFAMPSRGEGFGLVYIEAMRRGVPVVASTHDAAPEINLDGNTGYNVDLDRPSDLPDRLIHLLRHPNHAAALGLAGRARWEAHFRYSAFRRRFLPHLRAFLGDNIRLLA